MLFEAGITADETVLDFVVRNNAEDTQQSVQSLIGLVNTLADAKVQTMLVGKTPTKQERNWSRDHQGTIPQDGLPKP